jgi:hypothetical protein
VMASEMRPRKLMRLLNLASDGAGAITKDQSICGVSCNDDVPWRMNCAASWITLCEYGSSGKW